MSRSRHNSQNIPLSASKMSSQVGLSLPTLQGMSSVDLLAVPENSQLVKVDTPRQDNRFTEKRPFTFNELYPASHTFLLLPSEFPMPEESTQEFSPVITYDTPGKIPHSSTYKKLDQRRKIAAKIGYFEIPPIFLHNSNDFVPTDLKNNEKITNINRLNQKGGSDDVINITLEDQTVFPDQYESFFANLQTFKNLEILSLHGLGLNRLPPPFPTIRILDICDNNIDDHNQFLVFISKCVSLSILDYRRNPVAENEMIRLRIIATSVNLKYINGRLITVQNRLQAMNECTDQFRMQDIGKLHFLYQIKAIPEIAALPFWKPSIIQHLSLPNCGLTSFNVCDFTNLVSLNLKNNSIYELKGTGIVNCKKLISLNLEGNCLNSLGQLDILIFLDSLCHVWLNNNHIPNYRQYLIYKCRNLAGSTALSGLQTIDGCNVSVEEYISAISEYEEEEENPNKLYWYKNVERNIGNIALRHDAEIFEKINMISFSNRGLKQMNLELFTHLTHLSLRNNEFHTIKSLRKLQNLVLLDISHNPKLDLEGAINECSHLTQLQFLFLAVDCWRSDLNNIVEPNLIFNENANDRSIRNRSYREKVLQTLIQKLPYISSLDRMRITVNERCNVVKKNELLKGMQIEKYRVYVAFLQAAKPNAHLSYKMSEIIPGNQYDPFSVVSMKRLRRCGLTSIPLMALNIFQNLQEVDLSHNKITTLSVLYLDQLPQLKYCDLSFNNIEDSPKYVGELIDQIPNLIGISLRNNPIYSKPADRIKILKNIRRLQNANDCFKILDFELLPSEIIETRGVKYENQQEKAINMFFLALKTRLPLKFESGKITELNLDKTEISTCDLTNFAQLKFLYLRNNRFKKNTSIRGLKNCNYLELIDLRNNLFEHSTELVQIIIKARNLKNIGVDGNPVVNDKGIGYVRHNIISQLPDITNPFCVFMAIDDVPITPSEIRNTKKSNAIDDEFAFLLARGRNIPLPTIMDLSGAELCTYLNFTNCEKLQKLNLSHNQITLQAILGSKLDQCSHLEILDLSYNNIKLAEGNNSLGKYLSNFRRLKHLNIIENPCCPKEANWKNFMLTFNKLHDVSMRLTTINGHELDVEERSQIIQEQFHSEERAAGYRTNYLLFKINPKWKQLHTVSLPNCGITVLTPFSYIEGLQTLDLRSNNIKHLAGQGFEKLVNLRSLDIRDNQIESVIEIRDTLSLCPKLETLFMINSTSSPKETALTKQYLGVICNVLRGLNELDGTLNPCALKANQLNALKDLEQLVGWNNPNHIHDIDLSNRDITRNKFTPVVNAISVLGPRILNMQGNGCVEIPNYRFYVIYNVNSLTTLDSSAVTVDQRMNADQVIRPVVEEEKDNPGNKHKPKANSSVEKARYQADFGSLVIKWEIIITFEQILNQTIQILDKKEWPQLYLKFAWSTVPVSLDLNFMRVLLDIRFPFWFNYATFFIYILFPALLFGFYHYQFDREKWYDMFTINWKHTLCMSFLALFIMWVCSCGLVFLADFNYTIATLKISNNQIAWLCVMLAVSFLCVVIFWILAAVFRKFCKSPVFWFKLLKYKKYITLFLLTILYFPIVKSFIDTFLCVDGHSKVFDDVACFSFSHFYTIQIIHIAALVFGLIYAIGIPVFFIKLINKGANEIDLNYRISSKYQTLKEKKIELKARNKEGKTKDANKIKSEIIQSERAIKSEYQMAAIQYENAATYLYCAYDRPNRFKKVITMFEKLAYVIFTSFIPDQLKWLQFLLNGVVLLGFIIYQLLSMPFSALNENVFETIAKIGNFISLIVAASLNLLQTNELYRNTISAAILIGVIIIMIVLFICLIVRYHLFYSCTNNNEIEESDYEADTTTTLQTSIQAGDNHHRHRSSIENVSIDDEENILNTLKTLNIGDDVIRAGGIMFDQNSDPESLSDSSDSAEGANQEKLLNL